MQYKFKLSLMVFVFIAVCFSGISFGQELPGPNTLIDKNNYKKYSHLFPEEFLQIFETGFDGLIPPLRIQVVETTPSNISRAFLAMSQKNKGKYSLDQDGNVIGFDRNGWPFPELDKNDKDFVRKLMWNFDQNYIWDEYIGKSNSFEKRKGEKMKVTRATTKGLYYSNRICVDPKPSLSNSSDHYFAIAMKFTAPATVRDSAMLNIRYLDLKKKDTSFVYLPTMRRILRADSGQRSTPMGGSMISPDDTNGFGGRIPEFTYKLLGEQKVLCVKNCQMTDEMSKAMEAGNELALSKNWEIQDVYVVEITPKDPRYPQSKKIVYLDKTNLVCYYAVAFDKAGAPWKLFFHEFAPSFPFPGSTEDKHIFMTAQFTVDVQFGMAGLVYMEEPIGNRSLLEPEQFTPTSILRGGR